ncbi:MAG: serine/threonine protein kinase [Pirellulales bacterium]|nr:serine/threonine protein kinase [Pirellulales bacterium]
MPDMPIPSDEVQPHQGSTMILARTRLQILRKHAEGGLGQVAIALDRELSREIAFKEIQPKYANIMEARSRFVREAQITGGLEHPGIVPVYGIGQYEDGRPFYVMRFIQGNSLHEAIQEFHDADKHGRDPGERRLALQKLLGRFLDVCHAMGYAHSRGILHRDLKPGNIMLGEYGETLVVDWGLAKSVGQQEEGSERDMLPFLPKSSGIDQETRHGSAIGTPAFMSPEQAAGNVSELGLATDVYALGATLYTILTGQPPIEQTDNDLMLAKVIAGDFLRPREVNRAIPKPLEAVCLKAMANDPANRYASAVALANDVEHYLADERVTAYRESWIERTARWGRRYKTITRAVAVSLIAITAISIVFACVADSLRGRAVRAEASTSKMLIEKTEALKNEMTARKEADEVRERFIGAFRSPNPELDGRDIKVVDVLDRFVDELEQEKDMPPTLRAALTSTIGRTYSALGRYKEALPLHEKALKLRQVHLGLDHPDSLTAMNNLANAYHDVGTLDRAVFIHEETLKRRKEKIGPDHPDTLSSMNNLALAYTAIGRLDKALPLYEETKKLATIKLGANHAHTLKSMNNLANAYKEAGKSELAIPLLEEILKRRKEKFGPDHPDMMTSMISLANAYKEAGKQDLAMPLYEETLTLRQVKLGPDHPDTLTAMNCLANAYKDAGKLDQALPLFEKTLEQRKIQLGANHTGTLITMNDLGNAYMHAGALDKGLPLLEEALKLMEENLEPSHPYTLSAMNSLAVAYKKAGKLDKALPLFEKTLAERKTKLGPDHPSTLVSMNNVAMLGTALTKLNHFAEAEPLLLQGIQEMEKLMETIPPAYHDRITDHIRSLIELYKSTDQPDKASQWQIRLESIPSEQPKPES